MKPRANIQELKRDFPRFLKLLDDGVSFILCKRNIPVAEVCPLPTHPYQPRKFGQHKGSIKFLQDASVHLSPDEISAFEDTRLVNLDDDE